MREAYSSFLQTRQLCTSFFPSKDLLLREQSGLEQKKPDSVVRSVLGVCNHLLADRKGIAPALRAFKSFEQQSIVQLWILLPNLRPLI